MAYYLVDYENGVFTAKIMLRIQKTAVSHP